MSSRNWADAAVADLRRVQEAAQQVSGAVSGGAPGTGGLLQPRLDPTAVVAAAAEAAKTDSSEVRMLAIRLAQIAAKHPDMAA